MTRYPVPTAHIPGANVDEASIQPQPDAIQSSPTATANKPQDLQLSKRYPLTISH